MTFLMSCCKDVNHNVKISDEPFPYKMVPDNKFEMRVKTTSYMTAVFSMLKIPVNMSHCP